MHILLLVVHHRQGKQFSDDMMFDFCNSLHSMEIELDDEILRRQHYRNHLS